MTTLRSALRAVAAVAVAAVLAGCSDEGPDAAAPTTRVTTPTTVASSTTTTTVAPAPLLALPEEQAARAFIEAWQRNDRARMLELADPDDPIVDAALRLGTPTATGDFTVIGANTAPGEIPNPQVQVIVDLDTGRRAYLLMDGPGTGVNWVADYVPH